MPFLLSHHFLPLLARPIYIFWNSCFHRYEKNPLHWIYNPNPVMNENPMKWVYAEIKCIYKTDHFCHYSSNESVWSIFSWVYNVMHHKMLYPRFETNILNREPITYMNIRNTHVYRRLIQIVNLLSIFILYVIFLFIYCIIFIHILW